MKSNTSDSRVGERQLAASPALPGNDHRRSQETSHVFKCLQCDLQVQTDIAVVRRNKGEEEMIRVRLDPPTALSQDAESLVSRVIEQEVDRAREEGAGEMSC